MIMKKQQWLFKQVFSMINPSSSSSISFNNVVRRRRPFCSTTTTTTTTTITTTNTVPPPPPPPVSNKKHEFNMLLEKKLPFVSNNKQLNMLLEKKLPLLIVPYDHITPKEYALCPPRRYDLGEYYNVCDGTFGFINLFHDDDQLIIDKKKKEKEVYDVYLPEIAKRRICGSSEGWLVTAHQNGEFQLLNPVTRVMVHLPHFTALPTACDFHIRNLFIHKVVTNTTTTSSLTTLAAEANTVVVVMAIYGELHGSLSFYRTMLSTTTGNGGTTTITTKDETETAAAAAWIKIPVKIPISAGIFDLSEIEKDPYDFSYEVIDGVVHYVTMLGWWVDVTFYKGNFYTVDTSGMVGVVKGLDGPVPFVHFLIKGPEIPSDYCSHLHYLVECGGDLLMVMRETYETKGEEEEISYRTTGFRVLKLDLNNGCPSWVEEEATDLGEDCALFFGYNRSFSFSASRIPGCRGNCIYFTDNHQHVNSCFPNEGHDIGVYNLEDASFDKLNYETCSSQSQLLMPPPVWYVPN